MKTNADDRSLIKKLPRSQRIALTITAVSGLGSIISVAINTLTPAHGSAIVSLGFIISLTIALGAPKNFLGFILKTTP
jgi:hypothetical protein